ncbi:MAG: ribosomal protein alanine N-acetyltransferase [Cyanobacteria bacterium RYN_339]|nr:ribosomal protein alanine N-acetyltransferase [Cyanobacteria bacterium RYN_339]
MTVELQGARITLRMGTPADIPAILAYYRENEAFLKPWDPVRLAIFYTEGYWRDRLYMDEEDLKAFRSLHLFIFERSEVIGVVNFNGLVQGAAWYCNLGYGLAEKREGQGLMREALDLGLTYAFNELKLHRIQANYMPHNRRSGGLLRRLGFVVEGYARDYLYLNGAWEDHVLTSLTNPRWLPPG